MPASTGYRLYYWFTGRGSRTASTDGEGHVAMLGVFKNPQFTTRDGPHVGSTQAKVEQTLGASWGVSRNVQTGSIQLVDNALASRSPGQTRQRR